MQPGYSFANVAQSISVTYANTYGRFSVLDNLCAFSFAANGGVAGGPPVPLAAANEAQIFGTSNGIPPTSRRRPDQQRRARRAEGGPRLDPEPESRRRALPALARNGQGRGHRSAARRQDGARRSRIAEGVEEVLASGKLRRVPAVFVTGRNDGILPPNFTSRAYFGLNNVVDGSMSSLRYYEVTNAQHLDTFNQFPGYNDKYIPLHRYFIQAMDLMYAHCARARRCRRARSCTRRRAGRARRRSPPLTCRRSRIRRRAHGSPSAAARCTYRTSEQPHAPHRGACGAARLTLRTLSRGTRSVYVHGAWLICAAAHCRGAPRRRGTFRAKA